MGYLRVSCLPSTIILLASVCLPICLFCSCDCICERTTHARILEFLPWGPRPDFQRAILTTFFSPQLIVQFLQRASNGYFKENYNFPRFQRGANICQGVQLFPGGRVQMLISIETHITWYFPGGSRPTITPLDPHMQLKYACFHMRMVRSIAIPIH